MTTAHQQARHSNPTTTLGNPATLWSTSQGTLLPQVTSWTIGEFVLELKLNSRLLSVYLQNFKKISLFFRMSWQIALEFLPKVPEFWNLDAQNFWVAIPSSPLTICSFQDLRLAGLRGRGTAQAQCSGPESRLLCVESASSAFGSRSSL